jgi:3-hydroxyacyl-CoA dehydrogenase / 3-hydroxy-2-methylbutyryl-CoA dehydrogenase
VAFPRRLGRAEEFADLVCAVVTNQMLNAEVIRLDAGARLASR